MTIACTVAAGAGALTVTVTGRLGLDDVAPLRLRLMKCLAEQPDMVLVDLNGLRVENPLSLTVFMAVGRQAARWPGIPLLLCTDVPETRAQLRSGAYHRLPLFRTVESARKHAESYERSLPALTEEIFPIQGAVRHARNVATDACLRWNLPELVGSASLIANELVANVVVHAGTIATLRLSVRRRHLTIAVRDGSSEPPAGRSEGDRPGRGLLLVEAMAASWGWVPSEGGKVVWATLTR
jgi:hypothetical protein